MRHTLISSLLALAVASPLALAQRTKQDSLPQLPNTIARQQVKAPLAEGAIPDFWLTVLHNNDGEGKVLPISNGPAAGFGGAARFKTLVDSLKAEALTYPALPGAKGSVLISSGDNILPGITLDASIASGVYYDAILFDLLGYSAMTLGNHDFDRTPDVLANVIAATNNTKFISSNLNFSFEPVLLAQQNAGKLAPFEVVTVQGRQIGIIGATTETLGFISQPRNVVVSQVVPAVQSAINTLTNNGVNIIIVSTHLQGLSAELSMISQLSGVDVVIAGGGSELMANPTDLLVPGDAPNLGGPSLGGTGYPRWQNRLDGQPVPVVTTAGDYKYLGRLICGFDAAGNLLTIDGASGPRRVSNVAPDAVVEDPAVLAQVTAPVTAANANLVNIVIGSTNVMLDSRNGTPVSVRAQETNLGNLVADSLLWQTRREANILGVSAPVVALQNGGGLRLNVQRNAGSLDRKYTTDMLPFGNRVAIVEGVTPQILKATLENCVAAVAGTPNAISGTGRFAQISGMRVVWDATGQVRLPTNPAMSPGSRIREVVLADGRVIVRNGQIVPNAPTITIATLDFLTTGGDQYPLQGLPTILSSTTNEQALANYVTLGLGGQVTSTRYPNQVSGRIIRRN
jgi:5'-nucleotidase/UDP-sugar diphosphatase